MIREGKQRRSVVIDISDVEAEVRVNNVGRKAKQTTITQAGYDRCELHAQMVPMITLKIGGGVSLHIVPTR